MFEWRKRDGAAEAAMAERYRVSMGLGQAVGLLVERSALVAKFRAHSGSWPDGVDSRYDRWYRAGDWRDDGTFVGDLGWFDVLHPEGDVVPPACPPPPTNVPLPAGAVLELSPSPLRPKRGSREWEAEKKRRQRERKKEGGDG